VFCLLWGGRGSLGQGGRFEAERVEVQMMKQGKKEGDYAQPDCGTTAICIDANSSGWSRILLIFFVLLLFIFLDKTEQAWPWQKPTQTLSQQLSSWRQFGRRHHAAERYSLAHGKGGAPRRPHHSLRSSP